MPGRNGLLAALVQRAWVRASEEAVTQIQRGPAAQRSSGHERAQPRVPRSLQLHGGRRGEPQGQATTSVERRTRSVGSWTLSRARRGSPRPPRSVLEGQSTTSPLRGAGQRCSRTHRRLSWHGTAPALPRSRARLWPATPRPLLQPYPCVAQASSRSCDVILA